MSVVCVLAWPSHSETLRRSRVACSVLSAQVWRLCRARHKRHAFAVGTLLRWYRAGKAIPVRIYAVLPPSAAGAGERRQAGVALDDRES
jgi:hypothetical protein